MKNTNPPLNRISAAVLVALATTLSSHSAQAASGTWNTATDGIWSDPTLWTSGIVANGASFTAFFTPPAGGTTTTTTTLDTARTIGNILRGNSGTALQQSWTITSPTNVLTIDNGASNAQIINNVNNNSLVTVDTDMALNSNLLLSGSGNNNARVTLGATVGGHSITGTKNITFNNSGTAGTGTVTINSNINTSGGLTNGSSGNGSGLINVAGVIGANVLGVTSNSTASANSRIMTLSGANVYTSATTVTAGILRAGVASVANVSGAFGKNSAVTTANASTAILDLAGFNTQIGSITGGGSLGGNVTLGIGTLTVGGDNTSPAAFAGGISGSGGLTKIGTGTQTLSGVIGYTGATTVSQGILLFGAGASVSGTSGITVASGAAIGGGGSVTSSVALASGAKFVLSLTAPLTVTGVVSLDNTFSIASLVNSNGSAIDWTTVCNGTYTLIANNSDFSNIQNFGAANADNSLAGGTKSAYYQNGSLQLVVVPEPGTWALFAAGCTTLVAFRRRKA